MRHRQVLQDISGSRQQAGEVVVEGAREERPAEAEGEGGQGNQRGSQTSGGGDACQQCANRQGRKGGGSSLAEGESIADSAVGADNYEG